jgi:hypothetical protein
MATVGNRAILYFYQGKKSLKERVYNTYTDIVDYWDDKRWQVRTYIMPYLFPLPTDENPKMNINIRKQFTMDKNKELQMFLQGLPQSTILI